MTNDPDHDDHSEASLPKPVSTRPHFAGLILVALGFVFVLFHDLAGIPSDSGAIIGGITLIGAGLLFVTRRNDGRPDNQR